MLLNESYLIGDDISSDGFTQKMHNGGVQELEPNGFLGQRGVQVIISVVLFSIG